MIRLTDFLPGIQGPLLGNGLPQVVAGGGDSTGVLARIVESARSLLGRIGANAEPAGNPLYGSPEAETAALARPTAGAQALSDTVYVEDFTGDIRRFEEMLQAALSRAVERPARVSLFMDQVLTVLLRHRREDLFEVFISALSDPRIPSNFSSSTLETMGLQLIQRGEYHWIPRILNELGNPVFPSNFASSTFERFGLLLIQQGRFDVFPAVVEALSTPNISSNFASSGLEKFGRALIESGHLEHLPLIITALFAPHIPTNFLSSGLKELGISLIKHRRLSHLPLILAALFNPRIPSHFRASELSTLFSAMREAGIDPEAWVRENYPRLDYQLPPPR